MGVSRRELAKELKLSCTNVMLQCFDPQTRCIFILGTMFHLDSQTAGEILGMTPENYRQKLSRARKKMAGFLSVNCGLSATGCCSCEKRVGYAIQSHRLNPHKLDFHELKPLDYELLWDFKESMEEIDDQSIIFAQLPKYQSREEVKYFIQNVLASDQMKTIENYTGGLRK